MVSVTYRMKQNWILHQIPSQNWKLAAQFCRILFHSSFNYLTQYSWENMQIFLFDLMGQCHWMNMKIIDNIEIRLRVCWNITLKLVFRMPMFWQSSNCQTFIMSHHTCQVGMQSVMHQCVAGMIKASHQALKQQLVIGAISIATHHGMSLMTHWSKLKKPIR